VLKSFLDNPEDIDLFRAYIGITSMIGRCNFVSSNKPRILSRMLGLKSKAAFQYYSISDENLLPTIEMYRKKYHMNRILLTLAERKYIMYLSQKHVSVIYLSKYMEPDELLKLVKESRDRKNLKQKIKDATASL
jgi:hypothetical protein